MFVPNPDKTTWPAAFSKWRPKTAQGEDPAADESYEGLTPRGDLRTVLAVVQGRGSLSGHQVYHFEIEPKTGGVIACVMPIAEWSEKMRPVRPTNTSSSTGNHRGPWFLAHPESDCLIQTNDRNEYLSWVSDPLVVELTKSEYLEALERQDDEMDDLI